MYKAYLVQPHGCDYTIACGHLLIDLEATEQGAAIEELHRIVVEHYQGDIRLSDVLLLEVSEQIEIPPDDWYRDHEKSQNAQKQIKQEQSDRALYEQLRRRFG